MKAIFSILTVIAALAMTSCADSKTFIIDGKNTEIKPYGWMNKDARKVDGVKYKVNTGNIVWSCIGVETVIAPVLLTGLALYEPVSYDSSFDEPHL